MSNNQRDVAVIIYGRTYSQDFRMLFQPKDFTREDREWAEDYIFSSLRKPEALSDTRYRWSAFKNHRYQIFGISCLASSISTQTLRIPAKHENRAGLAPGRMTHDIENRPVQVFVGFVTNAKNESIPCINAAVYVYGKIYDEYVSNRWWDDTSNWRRTDVSEFKNIPGCFEKEADQLPNPPDDLQKTFQEFKQRATKSILIIPNIENQAQAIWKWFFLDKNKFCDSLCIGIPRETIYSKIYGKTKFDCVVADGVDNQFWIDREQSTEDNKEKKAQQVTDHGSESGSKSPENKTKKRRKNKRNGLSICKLVRKLITTTDKSRDSSSSDPQEMDNVGQEDRNYPTGWWETIHFNTIKTKSPDKEAGREE